MNTEPDQDGKLMSEDSEVVQGEVNLTEIKSDQCLEVANLTEAKPEAVPNVASETEAESVPLDKHYSIEPELGQDDNETSSNDFSGFNERLRSSLSYKGRALSRSIFPFSIEPVKSLSTENDGSTVNISSQDDIEDYKQKMMRQSDAFNDSIQERIDRERLMILQDEVALDSLGALIPELIPPYYKIQFAASKLKISKSDLIDRAIKGEIKLHIQAPLSLDILEYSACLGDYYQLSIQPTLLELTAFNVAEIERLDAIEVDRFFGGYFVGHLNHEGYLVKGLVKKVFGDFDDVYWFLISDGKRFSPKVSMADLVIFRNEVYKLELALNLEKSKTPKKEHGSTINKKKRIAYMKEIALEFKKEKILKRKSAPCWVQSMLKDSDYKDKLIDYFDPKKNKNSEELETMLIGVMRQTGLVRNEKAPESVTSK